MLRGRHAVVVGGSFCGLLTAQMLCRHYGSVTLLERDALPLNATERKGTPQTRHLHMLLPQGLEMLEAYLPGVSQTLRARGAVPVEAGREGTFHTRSGLLSPHDESIPLLCMSRDLLDSVMREGILSQPRLTLRQGCTVAGLRIDSSGTVRAVKISSQDEGGMLEELEADLVVDASGRGSALADWLTASGRRPPKREVVDSKTRYATLLLERVPHLPQDQKFIFLQASSETGRGAIFARIEGERAMMTFNSAGGQALPSEPEKLKAYARDLPFGPFAAILDASSPVGPVQKSSSTKNHRYLMRRGAIPDGLIVLGDAFTTLNPVYAQGMTLAGQGVRLLDRMLVETHPSASLSSRFHHGLSRQNLSAWTIATSEDFRYTFTEGRRPPGLRLLHRYLDRAMARGTRDPRMSAAVERVIMLVEPPTHLLSPSVLARALT